jgi:hypothetical protein
VSSAITTIDVVGPHDRTGELLGKEIQLVRGLRATEHSKAPLSVPLSQAPQAAGGTVKSFIPGGSAQLPIFPDHGRGKTVSHRIFHALPPVDGNPHDAILKIAKLESRFLILKSQISNLKSQIPILKSQIPSPARPGQHSPHFWVSTFFPISTINRDFRLIA